MDPYAESTVVAPQPLCGLTGNNGCDATNGEKPNQLYCTKEGKRGEKSELSTTAFRVVEKHYKLIKLDKKEAKKLKRTEQPTDFSEVVDMRSPETSPFKEYLVPVCECPVVKCGAPREKRRMAATAGDSHTKNVEKTTIYTFAGVPGLFLVPNLISEEQQEFWAKQCVTGQFPNSGDHPNNIVQVEGPKTGKTTSEYQQGMRWATLGYSYNWTTKTYDPKEYSSFPEELRSIMTTVSDSIAEDSPLLMAVNSSEAANAAATQLYNIIEEKRKTAAATMGHRFSHPFPTAEELTKTFIDYDPQTAIVNYFPVGAQMMAHQDVSEVAMHRPLVSMSLGCPSIFLMGTESRDDKPFAFKLRSGDVAVFTGPSRLAYHGVPRILDECPKYLLPSSSADGDQQQDAWKRLMPGLRLNINVRQVYDQHDGDDQADGDAVSGKRVVVPDDLYAPLKQY